VTIFAKVHKRIPIRSTKEDYYPFSTTVSQHTRPQLERKSVDEDETARDVVHDFVKMISLHLYLDTEMTELRIGSSEECLGTQCFVAEVTCSAVDWFFRDKHKVRRQIYITCRPRFACGSSHLTTVCYITIIKICSYSFYVLSVYFVYY
jgi:hypothetical protein